MFTNTFKHYNQVHPVVQRSQFTMSRMSSDPIGVHVCPDDIPIQRGNLSEFPHSASSRQQVTLRRGGRRTQIPTRRPSCDLTVHLRVYLTPDGCWRFREKVAFFVVLGFFAPRVDGQKMRSMRTWVAGWKETIGLIHSLIFFLMEMRKILL